MAMESAATSSGMLNCNTALTHLSLGCSSTKLASRSGVLPAVATGVTKAAAVRAVFIIGVTSATEAEPVAVLLCLFIFD